MRKPKTIKVFKQNADTINLSSIGSGTFWQKSMQTSNLFMFVLGLLFAIQSAVAADGTRCVYLDKNDTPRIVSSLRDVPYSLRASARCQENSSGYLARPEDISLKGSVRTENITSPLGPIKLRWARSAESLFGRTPMRATTEAASAVNRVISQSAFSSKLRNFKADWSIIFMDEQLPESQIPSRLINNCHPGWMVAPANIYIVAQRVAGGCGGARPTKSSVADKELSEVLIHEMGHAVEFALLDSAFDDDQGRAEGFATWFTRYVSGQNSLLDKNKINQEMAILAKSSFIQQPTTFSFDGSPFSYARASLYFQALEQRVGVRGIMDVYSYMVEHHCRFFEAVQQKIGWDLARFNSEVQTVLAKQNR